MNDTGNSATPEIRPKDRVRIDGAKAECSVAAVSRAGHDIYVTEDSGAGTWVAIASVTHVNGQAMAAGLNAAGGAQ